MDRCTSKVISSSDSLEQFNPLFVECESSLAWCNASTAAFFSERLPPQASSMRRKPSSTPAAPTATDLVNSRASCSRLRNRSRYVRPDQDLDRKYEPGNKVTQSFIRSFVQQVLRVNTSYDTQYIKRVLLLGQKPMSAHLSLSSASLAFSRSAAICRSSRLRRASAARRSRSRSEMLLLAIFASAETDSVRVGVTMAIEVGTTRSNRSRFHHTREGAGWAWTTSSRGMRCSPLCAFLLPPLPSGCAKEPPRAAAPRPLAAEARHRAD